MISFSLICKPCIGGPRGSCGTGGCIVVLGFGSAEKWVFVYWILMCFELCIVYLVLCFVEMCILLCLL